MNKNFQKRLLTWYKSNKRDLPWRRTSDPYTIWVSEIMLQQTQVETVIPYYQRWIKRFGTVQKLAAARLDDVLTLWEGLGYYSRARNLHKAAQEILHQHGGKIPSTSKELMNFPGIGPYTASAIASIAFNEDTSVVDGNVHRVISRLFLIKNDPEKVKQEANHILARGKAGEFNQAMMELGAMLCAPKNPQCSLCPVNKFCGAYRKRLQERYPSPAKRTTQKEIRTLAGLIWRDGKILIHQRPLNGLLGGLWEFPNVRVSKKENAARELKKYLLKSIGIQIRFGAILGAYRHIYTHLKEAFEIYECHSTNGKSAKLLDPIWKWIDPSELDQFAFTGISGKARSDFLFTRSGFISPTKASA